MIPTHASCLCCTHTLTYSFTLLPLELIDKQFVGNVYSFVSPTQGLMELVDERQNHVCVCMLEIMCACVFVVNPLSQLSRIIPSSIGYKLMARCSSWSQKQSTCCLYWLLQYWAQRSSSGMWIWNQFWQNETKWVWYVYECVLVQFVATFPYQSSCLLHLPPSLPQTDKRGEEWKSTPPLCPNQSASSVFITLIGHQ